MKAVRSGTVSEQRRYNQGWVSAKAREPAACKNCPAIEAHGTERGSGMADLMSYRCRKGDFATAPGAICKHHPFYREDGRGRVL